jgi:hypothetical protein
MQTSLNFVPLQKGIDICAASRPTWGNALLVNVGVEGHTVLPAENWHIEEVLEITVTHQKQILSLKCFQIKTFQDCIC